MRTFLLALTVAAAAGAQVQRPDSVQTSATATISVAPDQARIQVGVVSQAPTAAAAASQNAALLQKALDQLKAAAGPKAEVKTVSYTLLPVYDKNQTAKAFRANNVVQVVTDELASVGKIVDAATQSGANEVESVAFTLRDPAQARGQALRKAALQARSDAEAMAAALGLKLGKVIYLDEGSPLTPRPIFAAAQRVSIAATPIEQPQTIDVNATVTLTIALGQ